MPKIVKQSYQNMEQVKLDKEYLVTPASSGKGWDCSSYCPLDESWFDPLEFDKTATNLGKVKIGGKSYDQVMV